MGVDPHEGSLTGRLAVLHEIALALSSEQDRRRLFEAVVQGASRLLGAPVAAVGSWDPGREELVLEGAAGLDSPVRTAAPTDLRICIGPAFLERRTVVVADTLADPRFSFPGLRLRAGIATPLLREGRPLGVLYAAHLEPGRRFDEDDVRLLELLAGHVALALINAETIAAASRRLARADELANVLRGVFEARTRLAVVERTLDCATTVLGADRAAVYLLDRREAVCFAAGRRLSREYLDWVARNYRRTAGGLLHLTRSPVLVPDLATDPRTRALHELAAREGIHTMLLLPLLRRGELAGGVALYHDVVWSYEPEEMALARALADQVAIAIENASLHEQSARQVAEMRVLDALAQSVAQARDPVDTSRRAARAIVAGGGASVARVLLPGPAGDLDVIAAEGPSALPVESVREMARAAHAERRIVTRRIGADALVAAPILHGDRPLGALVLSPRRAPEPSPRPGTTITTGDDVQPEWEGDFAGAAAGQIGTALANTHLFAAERLGAARLAAVIAEMPDGLLVFNEHGRVTFHNRRALEIYGLEGTDVSGWSPTDFLARIGDRFQDPAVPREIVHRTLERPGEPSRLEFEIVYAGRRVVERISAPVPGADGQPLGQVVLFHDLTRLRQAERANTAILEMATRMLGEPLEQARRLRARAHAGHPPGIDEVREHTGLACLVERLAAVVEDLRDSALLSSGRLTLDREVIDAAELVEHARARAAPCLEGRAIEVGSAGGPLPVHADRARLARALYHVLALAARAAPTEAPVRIALAPGTHEEAPVVRVRVLDAGGALDAAARADLLDAGRGDTQERLGFHVARESIALHGGRLDFRDLPEGGVVAELTLPRARARGEAPEHGVAAGGARP